MGETVSAARTEKAAGIGCRRDAPLADVLAAIDAALAVQQLSRGDLDALATIAPKRHEPAIAAAAETLGVPLVIVSAAAARDASGRCLTLSAASLAATGVACVSEAAALAAIGPRGRLTHPRAVRGAAACAIAITPPSVREARS
ncbi:cobalamin biosynthesis protein [Pseudochelatococcus lubricantis]|uniref:cobalamin biosynthesis protein n=1 Tax=Pseudochelatococcus lubricantis TaxID=1538102 RepID=UPI0035E7BFE3